MLESCLFDLSFLLSLHGSSPGPQVGTWEMETRELDEDPGDAPTTRDKGCQGIAHAYIDFGVAIFAIASIFFGTGIIPDQVIQ
jgi:hypothetical protein